jgi:hypothetical protein
MRLTRPWNTWLEAKYLAPKLSHHNLACFGHETPISSSNIWIHATSADAFVAALYSASMLDLETVGWLRALHETLLEKWFMVTPLDFKWCRLVTIADAQKNRHGIEYRSQPTL